MKGNVTDKVEIAVIGGSGFYEFLENPEEIEIDTPYGLPSDKIAIGRVGEKKIAFLPRHGRDHQFPPHKVPYLANIYALKELGVTRIIAPSASGSLSAQIKPGNFVICDQFVDRTRNRQDTYYDGPKTVHISSAEPYCPQLRKLAIETCRNCEIPVHAEGTVVVINGPRFSTKAESRWFASQGWQVINMTQYPEVVLAREQEICYVNISLITDYDAGLAGAAEIEPVSLEEVIKVFKQNNEKVKEVIKEIILNLPKQRVCGCSQALKRATF